MRARPNDIRVGDLVVMTHFVYVIVKITEGHVPGAKGCGFSFWERQPRWGESFGGSLYSIQQTRRRIVR